MAFLSKENASPEDCEIRFRAIGTSNESMEACITALAISRARVIAHHVGKIKWREVEQSRLLLEALDKYNLYGMMPPCGARNGSVVAYVKGEHV